MEFIIAVEDIIAWVGNIVSSTAVDIGLLLIAIIVFGEVYIKIKAWGGSRNRSRSSHFSEV